MVAPKGFMAQQKSLLKTKNKRSLICGISKEVIKVSDNTFETVSAIRHLLFKCNKGKMMQGHSINVLLY